MATPDLSTTPFANFPLVAISLVTVGLVVPIVFFVFRTLLKRRTKPLFEEEDIHQKDISHYTGEDPIIHADTSPHTPPVPGTAHSASHPAPTTPNEPPHPYAPLPPEDTPTDTPYDTPSYETPPPKPTHPPSHDMNVKPEIQSVLDKITK